MVRVHLPQSKLQSKLLIIKNLAVVLSKELIMAKEVLLRKKYKIAIIKEKNGSF